MLCCITVKQKNFSFPRAGHSPSDVTHLLSASSAPAQKGNLSFRSETTPPPKSHTISSGQRSVMRFAAPLASEQLKWMDDGEGLLAFTLAGFALAFRALLNLPFSAERRERKSHRNLPHPNLVFALVREEGVNFLPLPPAPSHLEGTRGWGSHLKSRGGNRTESKNWKCMRKQCRRA